MQLTIIDVCYFLQMPLFSVDGMEPGVVFRFIIYSVNDKGRSEPFILGGFLIYFRYILDAFCILFYSRWDYVSRIF